MTYAKVIKDSVSPSGVRLTTFEVQFHRFVLAEFNTHRVLSKNSASSRAIPVSKQIDRVVRDPAFPVAWPQEQKGMQGGALVIDKDAERAEAVWRRGSEEAVITAAGLVAAGVHKSVTNRVLEPYMMHTVVVTATAWENFFNQRCSPLAQPEIRAAADMMRKAYDRSEPVSLTEGEWHAPYLQALDFMHSPRLDIRDWVKVSAARCARVSYLTHDGHRDPQADLTLYDRLVDADPPHWSPLEHVATPDGDNVQVSSHTFYSERLERWVSYPVEHLPVVGNLLGWRSLRVEVEAERGLKTYI